MNNASACYPAVYNLYIDKPWSFCKNQRSMIIYNNNVLHKKRICIPSGSLREQCMKRIYKFSLCPVIILGCSTWIALIYLEYIWLFSRNSFYIWKSCIYLFWNIVYLTYIKIKSNLGVRLKHNYYFTNKKYGENQRYLAYGRKVMFNVCLCINCNYFTYF